MTKRTFYGVLLALALSAVIYYSDSPETILGTYNSLETEVDVSPFAVARGATTTVYDDSGQVAYTFNAVRLEHYTDEKLKESSQAQEHVGEGVFTLVEKPQLIIYQNNEPWLILANKGKMTSSDQQIELWQNVMVKHLSKAGVATEINTERLFIDPIRKFANTDEIVKISSEKIELEGVGMTADLTSEKINLLSQVHGIHDPS
ncbi:Lipopolysaccharide export system protein LptC [Thalassocella blandensis]|nr:Lipopolysaccharide export system protein LptC [Thalassocella blandensis]